MYVRHDYTPYPDATDISVLEQDVTRRSDMSPLYINVPLRKFS